MPETSDLLAYRLYETHQRIRQIKSRWQDLGGTERDHWRALAEVAIEFCAEVQSIGEEEMIG